MHFLCISEHWLPRPMRRLRDEMEQMDIDSFSHVPVSSFYGRKSFSRLQDAADCIETYEGGEVDVIILPPEPDALTDEEEFDDENIDDNRVPVDVPGSVEVDFGSDIEEDLNRDSENWNESDEETLANIQRLISTNSKKVCSWKLCEADYKVLKNSVGNGSDERLDDMKRDLNYNPKEIFEKLFSNDVFQLIRDQTILYAQQKNRHDFSVTIDEIKNFIGILLLSGYHKLPQQKMYWSLDEDLGVEIVSKCMSRNRFLEIKKFLHFADNTKIDKKDKMYKLRSLMVLLNKQFRQWGIFHKYLSVDEAMIKYFGHHSSKQFMRGKPVRFGFKDWMLCSSTGYCYAFETYCGKNLENKSESLGLGANVVLSFTEHLENPQDHIIFFDNFFTTLDLVQTLKGKGIHATGTIRDNRQKKCPVESSKIMNKKERGSFDYRFDKNNEILLVKWKDNSVCSIATNYDHVEPCNNFGYCS
ncbi:hypothetical protein NQ315_013451 [Exocentrus adspersus]|uniref:PiggyBac transposable element-derived protein domain-containing protein n=1 Tax=Exocentrus adspersus TaxID=1586481 RepID=A0AAV8V586_9CUCU|nr:hypothetical protein NQ315_013451 [Exocentrus adspersus]